MTSPDNEIRHLLIYLNRFLVASLMLVCDVAYGEIILPTNSPGRYGDRYLKDNLYRLWNRMSSGSYFPPTVRMVEIPKDSGGIRTLGIPTVADRIAQMVATMYLEPLVQSHFHQDSYAYRPGKSAIQAVGGARQRCWRLDWVLDLDIKGFLDNLDHALLLRTVRKHTNCRWLILYVERWLQSPAQLPDGALAVREKGDVSGRSNQSTAGQSLLALCL